MKGLSEGGMGTFLGFLVGKMSICFVLEKKEKRRKGNMICGYVRLVSECWRKEMKVMQV